MPNLLAARFTYRIDHNFPKASIKKTKYIAHIGSTDENNLRVITTYPATPAAPSMIEDIR